MKSTIANRIKEGLEARGMKQIDLASLTGISKSSISTYMTGEYEPKQKNIYKMAKALQVNEAWLLGHDVPMDITYSTIPPNKIPILGSVAAGVPIECIQDIKGYVEIPDWLLKRGNYFALKVKGRSMEPEIMNGDIIIIRQQQTVENDEIGVVVVDGEEATVKQVKRSDNGIMLVPFNRDYEPKFYTAEQVESRPVSIIGKVVELRRAYDD